MLIKTLESIDQMVNRLESTQHTLRQRVMQKTVFSVFSNLILSFGFSLGYLLAFLWAAVRMIDHSLSFGGMVAFLQLVNRIQSPARSLTKLVPAFVEVLTTSATLTMMNQTERGSITSPSTSIQDHVQPYWEKRVQEKQPSFVCFWR